MIISMRLLESLMPFLALAFAASALFRLARMRFPGRAMGLWALVRRSGDGRDGPDLGTISGQWIAERRVHERESSSDR